MPHESLGQIQGWVTLTDFSRSQRLKGKKLSWRYLNTYNLYHFLINTSDPYHYDKTQC